MSRSLFWFGWYYFRNYFTHDTPEYHLELTHNLQFEDFFKFLINEAHKDSAKTSWARIAFIWRICTRRSYFMFFVCHDKKKAESHLFDISVTLQTNQRLIEDFGQLFYEDPVTKMKRSQKKTIDEFITVNGIKVKASSTGISLRGEIFEEHRPDYINLDDIENDKTKRSEARTKEVKDFIDETLTGLTAAAKMVFSVNKISNTGSVAFLEAKAQGNPDFKLWQQPLIKDGNIQWEGRFVWTDKEAREINGQLKDPKHHVFSIESLQRNLGTRRFNQEYQLIPMTEGDSVLKEEWITDNYYTNLPDKGILNKVIMVDPQSGEKKDADYYGMCTVAWKRKDEHRYVKNIRKGRATKLKQAALVAELWQKESKDPNSNVLLVGVETVLTQVAVYQLLLDWKAGRIDFGPELGVKVDNSNRNIPLIAVRPVGKEGKVLKDKVARLEYHEAAFERGEVHLHHTMRKFTEQLASFPHVEHDDDIDAMIYALDYSYKSGFTPSSDSSINNSEASSTIVGNANTMKF